MFKSNGGFTLVELIVVIAILGLLAGIGLPAYTTYMEKAKTNIEAYEESQEQREEDIKEVWNDVMTNDPIN